MPPSPLEKAWRQFALCAIVFLAITLPWAAGSDLWFDETMTLCLYVFPSKGLWQILRNYSEANNHFLNSAITWLWMNEPNFNHLEIMLRLPCLLAGLGTLATIIWGWRDVLGRQRALLCGVIMAASPIFCPFAYQMRGYIYGMLLAALATAAALRLAYLNERSAPWQSVAFFSCLLLPFAAPTCAMAVMPGTLLIFTETFRRTRKWQAAILRAAPSFVGGVLGVSYYFTLWDAFRHASKSAGGWTSSWLVAAHLLLAFAIHGLAIILPAIYTWRRKRQFTLARGLLLVFHAVAVIAVLLSACMFTSSHAPFPRIFTVLLPGFTASLAIFFTDASIPLPWNRLKLAIALSLLWGVAVIHCSNLLTANQISHGKAPQNLLQQYYRGDSSNSEAIAALTKSPERVHDTIIVPAIDEFTFSFYWLFMAQLVFPDTKVIAVNRLPANYALPRRTLVSARNPEEAETMLKAPAKLLINCSTRQIYEAMQNP